jgi:hypothetical protein
MVAEQSPRESDQLSTRDQSRLRFVGRAALLAIVGMSSACRESEPAVLNVWHESSMPMSVQVPTHSFSSVEWQENSAGGSSASDERAIAIDRNAWALLDRSERAFGKNVSTQYHVGLVIAFTNSQERAVCVESRLKILDQSGFELFAQTTPWIMLPPKQQLHRREVFAWSFPSNTEPAPISRIYSSGITHHVAYPGGILDRLDEVAIELGLTSPEDPVECPIATTF